MGQTCRGTSSFPTDPHGLQRRLASAIVPTQKAKTTPTEKRVLAAFQTTHTHRVQECKKTDKTACFHPRLQTTERKEDHVFAPSLAVCEAQLHLTQQALNVASVCEMRFVADGNVPTISSVKSLGTSDQTWWLHGFLITWLFGVLLGNDLRHLSITYPSCVACSFTL